MLRFTSTLQSGSCAPNSISLNSAIWVEYVFRSSHSNVITLSLDIFPLGCCDHRFCDHISFPLCFFKYLFSQSSHSSTSQALPNCRNCESCESNCDSPHNDIRPFFIRTCFPRVPNMIKYIVSPYLQLSNGK
jgi:hypothetical protein